MPAAEDDMAGRITRIQASAVAVRDALPRALAVNDPIYVGDVISTGKDARLEARMTDGSVLTLGERTSFVVIDYVFREGVGHATSRLMSGAMLAVSGQIAKLEGNPFKIETEAATIGIRGTTVWGGIIDDAWGVVMLEGTGVTVENRLGRVEITAPDTGTSVKDSATAPISVRPWNADKLARAKRTVTFN
ncbi:MAG: hypothetical protein A3J29_13810 [Acidobacteria bacterium RIFCSPLOWO2_12_FULL_67_14b]|nr:MAG: hypothetical protein A3J29_13810 [Acidobacteria bacterium RIFCSPLOWO2_12_FULL_67_14b]